jgi:hypothetical protein
MDYSMLSVGQNFYATDGIFLSKSRNNPQYCRKIPQKCRKIPLHIIEVFCFTFFLQDGTEQTFFKLVTVIKSLKSLKNFLSSL